MSEQEMKPTEHVEAPVEVSTVEAASDAPAVQEPTETATESTEKSKSAGRSAPEGMLRVSGRKAADDKVHRNNVKFDPSVLPETDDPKQIRTQVEFYFSNSNLPSDKFLFDLVGGAENKAVPVKTISSFKRMRRFQPYSAVVNALKESKVLVVEGEEGEETIRRKTPYDPAKQSQVEEQSVYVKGFGDETPSTQFDIESFFTQHGQINSVRLRRADNKAFKGSVFVEWADKETAEKFLALDPKPDWKGHPLLIMSKKEYVDQKNEDIREGRIQPNEFKGRGSGRGGRGGRGGRAGDSDDWKKRRDQDQRNGFKDRRGGRDNRGRGRGRGGNGRGRGGRDRQEGGRDNAVKETEQRDNRDVGRPKINISEGSNGKRTRDSEGQGEEPPTKKVDTKEATA